MCHSCSFVVLFFVFVIVLDRVRSPLFLYYFCTSCSGSSSRFSRSPDRCSNNQFAALRLCWSSSVDPHRTLQSTDSIFRFRSFTIRTVRFMASAALCSCRWSRCPGGVCSSSSLSCTGYLQIFWTGLNRKPSIGIRAIRRFRRHAYNSRD